MKDFRELLKIEFENVSETEFWNDLGIDTGFDLKAKLSFRVFKQININNYYLSVQASQVHYCEPRETLKDIYEYNSMEVAIFKNREWCNVEDDPFFNTWNCKDEFLKYYNGMVAGYIPITLIQNLYEFLAQNSK